jgi:hypothetical protein
MSKLIEVDRSAFLVSSAIECFTVEERDGVSIVYAYPIGSVQARYEIATCPTHEAARKCIEDTWTEATKLASQIVVKAVVEEE